MSRRGPGGESSLGYLFGAPQKPSPSDKPASTTTNTNTNTNGSDCLPTTVVVEQVKTSSKEEASPNNHTHQPTPTKDPPNNVPVAQESQAPLSGHIGHGGEQGRNVNNYHRQSGQNVGNFITDRPTTRVHAAPGGGSSLGYLFGGPPS